MDGTTCKYYDERTPALSLLLLRIYGSSGDLHMRLFGRWLARVQKISLLCSIC